MLYRPRQYLAIGSPFSDSLLSITPILQPRLIIVVSNCIWQYMMSAETLMTIAQASELPGEGQSRISVGRLELSWCLFVALALHSSSQDCIVPHGWARTEDSPDSHFAPLPWPSTTRRYLPRRMKSSRSTRRYSSSSPVPRNDGEQCDLCRLSRQLST